MLGSSSRRIGVVRSYSRKSHIIHEDDPADHVYEVVSGTVCACKMLREGRRQIAGQRGGRQRRSVCCCRRLEKRERLFPTIDARNSTGAPITQEPMGAPLIFEISGYPIISPLISKYCSRVISPRA